MTKRMNSTGDVSSSLGALSLAQHTRADGIQILAPVLLKAERMIVIGIASSADGVGPATMPTGHSNLHGLGVAILRLPVQLIGVRDQPSVAPFQAVVQCEVQQIVSKSAER